MRNALPLFLAGVRGIAPVRAALSWTPVLAHAGSCRVVRLGVGRVPAIAVAADLIADLAAIVLKVHWFSLTWTA